MALYFSRINVSPNMFTLGWAEVAKTSNISETPGIPGNGQVVAGAFFKN